MKKRCSKCGDKKLFSEFSKSKDAKDGLQSWCKKCYKEHHQTHKNPKRKAEYDKKYRQTEKGKFNYESSKRNLKNHHGVTLEQYDKMFEEQGGVCAICSGVNKNGRRLAIDHNHNTGEIRGLLCANCNIGIGMLKENVNILCSAISYLGK